MRLGLKLRKGQGLKAVNTEVRPLDGTAREVDLNLGSWQGKLDFSIAPIDDFDIVLGMEFFRQFNVIPLPRYNAMCIMEGGPCMIPTMSKPSTNTKRLFAIQLEKEFEGAVKHIAALCGQGERTLEEIPRDMGKAFEEVKDVIPSELPKELLPNGEVDHKLEGKFGTSTIVTNASSGRAQMIEMKLRSKIPPELDLVAGFHMRLLDIELVHESLLPRYLMVMPVKDILKCKCVSKIWRDITSVKSFCKEAASLVDATTLSNQDKDDNGSLFINGKYSWIANVKSIYGVKMRLFLDMTEEVIFKTLLPNPSIFWKDNEAWLKPYDPKFGASELFLGDQDGQQFVRTSFTINGRDLNTFGRKQSHVPIQGKTTLILID
ncbi:hypothetical protein FNV43_RR11356 [Rhamnella rubrinervis]|uniref:Uncharacterized protein n=1 Tax=Rhamnella rubrinervis TaxID=2594499 RepID=A0A8K0H5D6_9ROSA|nr:hypothetical protein FNV43_RR11356 [Rhamnella rubrinervis]